MASRWIVAGACALALAACSTTGTADAPNPGEVVLVLDTAPA
jgi:hypothetical protein